MISSLRIENFALIDQLELDLHGGLNVLTGETGAGKSIILDAIDVALGGKVTRAMLRQGATKSKIEATFQASSTVRSWLERQEIELLDDGESVVVVRDVSLAKENLRTRSRINGVLVNRQLIGELRDRLVEITAQGQTVQLFIPSQQRELLDLYGGEELLQQRQLVSFAYEKCQAAQKALQQRRQSERDRLQRLDLLQYQITELETAKLEEEDELEQLQQEGDRLAHVVELQQLSYQAYQLLYQSDADTLAVADLLAQAESTLTEMVDYDSQLTSILEMIQAALNQVIEAGHQVNSYGDGLEADPGRLQEVEERISTLKQICRKYGPSLTEAIAYYQKLQAELAELTDEGQSIEELEAKYKRCQAKLTKLCQQLTQQRQKAANRLENRLIEALKPLAMEKVIFECRLTPANPGATGADTITFYFSPNPGEKLQPLSTTASGGEMSRFLLALKSCFSDLKMGAATLIFDEIDAGVSGKVAQAIANKLHQLSNEHQVLCVTHQPLVAAMADMHFRVNKEVIDELTQNHNGNGNDSQAQSSTQRTVVRIAQLDNHQTRREELAQLTGGHSAQDAIAFAESLLANASNQRKNEKSREKKRKLRS